MKKQDALTFCIGVSIQCYLEQGLSPLTNLWLEEAKKYCVKIGKPVTETYRKLCKLQTEEIAITELELSYTRLLTMCTLDLREEIREAVDTICLEGLTI